MGKREEARVEVSRKSSVFSILHVAPKFRAFSGNARDRNIVFANFSYSAALARVRTFSELL